MYYSNLKYIKTFDKISGDTNNKKFSKHRLM